MVKVRLARGGRKKAPFFRIVVADSRKPRDGRYIEQLGYFDPLLENLEGCKLNVERLEYWISVGAQVSNRVQSIYKAAKKQTA